MSATDRLDLLAELVAISRWQQVYETNEGADRVREINEQLNEETDR